ncbi:MAG: hypothetical protein C4586_08545 [Anaerolineaceae bacterium]|nr:MAG: hypothetical protein C4586_08545 [Anaerolineaceae bacterium]
MEKNTQEVQLTVGKTALPDDHISFKDTTTNQERHFLRGGVGYTEVTKDPITPIRRHNDRLYTANDSEAFVNAINKCGAKPEEGVIFYVGEYGRNNTKITMFFDEKTRQERIALPLAISLEMKAIFLNRRGEPGIGEFDQKSLLKLFDTYPECFQNSGLLRGNIALIKMDRELKFESDLDPDNTTLMFADKNGAQISNLPKKLTLTLPFYEGSENKIRIEADFEVEMPKSQDEKPVFKIINVKHERTERDALAQEIATLKTKLPGWVFLNGKFSSNNQ